MANSSPDSRGREPYERYSLNRLGSPFGVYLEQKDSGDVKVPVPDSHRYLGDVKSFQYGQGCIMALSARTGVRHEVILTYQNEPIIVLAQLGLGKALFVGDVSPFGNDLEEASQGSNPPVGNELAAPFCPRGRFLDSAGCSPRSTGKVTPSYT